MIKCPLQLIVPYNESESAPSSCFSRQSFQSKMPLAFSFLLPLLRNGRDRGCVRMEQGWERTQPSGLTPRDSVAAVHSCFP